MAKLNPDQNQQERRATKSEFLAELVAREFAGEGLDVVFKGEAIEINRNKRTLVTITSNADETFTVDDDRKRLSSAEIGSYLKTRLAQVH